MKITNINFSNIKTVRYNNALKFVNNKSLVSLNRKPVFDTFKGRNSQTEKAIELHNLLNGRVEKPAIVIEKFSQYTGDDYEAAKILASSMSQDKSGFHFSLSKENREKIKLLEPECPYLKAYIDSIE